MVHLHLHTVYSALDGLGSPKAYVLRAKELGMKAIAITDHGNVDGALEFQQECEENGIKPIFGCEFYIVNKMAIKEKGEIRSHLTAWATNEIGWKNILTMVTKSFSDGFYRKPRIDPNLLLKHCEGLIIGGACMATWLKEDWGVDLLEGLIAKGIKVMPEIMPFSPEWQRKNNMLQISIAQRYGLDLIATNDCHYVTSDYSKAQECLTVIRNNDKWNNPNRKAVEVTELYMKSEIEMIESFKVNTNIDRRTFQRAINNTEKVFEACKDFRIKPKELFLPQIPSVIKSKKTDKEFLTDLIEEGFNNKIKGKVSDEQVYRDRIKEELDLIYSKKFERYFLLVWDCIRFANENDILVGPARGSGSGGLVNYLIGITKVDPIKHGLLFARFINAERNDYPDIDVDYANKDKVREYLSSVYGRDKVAGISTFNYINGRSTIKDVCRAFDIPFSLSNTISKLIVKDVVELEQSEEGKAFIKEYPIPYDMMKKVNGAIKGRGQHACGIVISQNPLTNGDNVALCYTKDGDSGANEIIINFDKRYVEYVGLMKLDILGLKELDIINNTVERIEQNHGKIINLEEINLNDRRCLREISKGNTIGCFQLGSYGLKKYCTEIKTSSFNDVVSATSLYRPGTLHSGMADEYVKRKFGKKYTIHPCLVKYLGWTYGIIIYQEQVMQIVADVAGLGWGVANKIRKVIAKSMGEEEMLKWEGIFVKGCVENNTLNENEATDLFKLFIDFGAYSFNYSHAVSYSYITMWDAWLKFNYTPEFYASSLIYADNTKVNPYSKTTALQDMLDDAWKNGVEIRPPKVGISEAYKWATRDNIVYAPYISIKGVGLLTAQKYVEASKPKRVETYGFFNLKEDTKPVKEAKILKDINAYVDEPLTYDESYRLEPYFNVILKNV